MVVAATDMRTYPLLKSLASSGMSIKIKGQTKLFRKPVPSPSPPVRANRLLPNLVRLQHTRQNVKHVLAHVGHRKLTVDTPPVEFASHFPKTIVHVEQSVHFPQLTSEQRQNQMS